MLRIADLTILTIVWLAAIGFAVRWVLRYRAAGISVSARAPIVAVVLLVVAGGAFFLGHGLRGNERPDAPPIRTEAPSTMAAQPFSFPSLDALILRGPATGELRVAPAPGHGGDARYPATTDLVLTGRIAGPANARGGDVFLVIDDRFRYPGIDVAAAAPRGGFALALPLDRVTKGEHSVQAALRAANGSGFYLLPAKVRFTVVD